MPEDQRPAWATWDPQSTGVYASPELALVEALDWFGPAFARWVSARAARSGPTSYPRLRVVRVLARRGPQQPIAVAAELAMSQASLTGLVDGLVTDGLVVRVPHPTDGRAQLLTLTDAGTAAAGDATSVTAAAELFAGMPRQDVLAALEVVKELSARLRAATRAQEHPLMP